ncbi:hypothetical protein EGW08_020941 [Elysia chlorotica]|uniref:G-protein coupled receptors family 2 profile 2 domain-containing protein n=1 Tax=Elysia chlorotica TaxID=188477 RepID=A0A433SPZ2_ELYCH|nr:hypothetical protein EGW08_020941 [Elysia chlorotica]
MNINKRKEQNVFVLHLLWRKRFGGSFQTPSVGKLVVEEVDKIKSKTMDRVEYRDAEYVALPANFNKRKKEGFNRLRAKNPTQIDFFLGPDIKFDRDEVLFDIKTNSNDVNKPLIRFMKEYETHIKQTNVAKQTGSLSSKLEMSKCLVPCQNLRDFNCSEYVELYPDTCERSGLDAGECWLRILREALHCLKLTACDLGGCDLSTKYGNTDMFTTPNNWRRKQKHLEYGQEKLQTLSNDVHEYIASVMKQLDITNYLLLKYISKLHTPEQYDLSKFSDHIDEMRSVLYLQTSTTQNRTVLEEKLTRQFHGEYFIEKSASPLLVMMLSSTPVLRFADFSLSISKSQWVTGSNVNCQIGSPTLDALTSFYQQVCGPSPQRFNSNNIIGVDLTSTCPFVSFNASDFNVSDTGDNSISLISEEGPSLTVPRFNYTMDGERVHICLKTLNILMKKERIPLQHSLLAQMENILTIISLCLSLASLLALFVTYSVFPTLRSLPGKNNMILVFWIFVAQLQLCLEPFWRPYHKTCMMMGILLHVSWLYTIVWTTVCSFHMCRIFAAWRGVALKHSTSHRFYLIRYLVGSSTFSFCLVAAVIVGSGASSDWTEIGYGGRGVCYLSSTLLVLLAFALPLALTLAINSALFGLTVLSISRVDAIQRQAGRERRNAHVYLRLSSLTGLCWTLALLAEIPGLSPLRCVSVVVNGCQGLFLFLSYACNRRVYRLWTNVLSTKAGRSPGMERGAQLRSHKLTRIERSSSRRTGSTVVAGLV